MGKLKAVIFDFDGTLADTAPLMRKIYADLATQHGLRTMSDEDYALLRKGTVQEARRWSGAKWWQVPLMVRSVKKLMQTEAEKVKLFPGAVELVRDLCEQEVEVYILSRNRPATIARTLERYKLHKNVHILARRRWTLGGKAGVIRRLLRKSGVNQSEVCMVGDEIRDIKAAHGAGVISIAVPWGLQDESILAKYQPTHMVHSMDELHQTIIAI